MVAGLALLCDLGGMLSAGRRTIRSARIRAAGGGEAAALICIVVVAVLLRTWHLTSVPLAVGYDEADSALDSARLFHLPFQALGPSNWGHNPSLYFYAMAFLFKLAGETITVARLTSALFGVVGVVGVYLVGRQMLGPAYGLCGGTLLAVSAWSVHFSRYAIMDIGVPTLVSVGLAAALLGMRRREGPWFAVAGVLFGLTVMTYAGGFLAVAVLTVWMLGYTWARARPDERRTTLMKALFLPLCIVVASMPFLVMLHLDPSYTLWREQQISLFRLVSGSHAQLDALLTNLRAHALMFTVMGDKSGANNLPGQPMLDTVSGSCFLVGLGICLRNFRALFAQVLLLWLSVCLLAGILSNPSEAPEAARTIGAVAPAALIAAIPLALLGQWIGRLPLPTHLSHRTGHRIHGREVGWATHMSALAVLAVVIPISAALAQTTRIYFSAYADNLTAWETLDGPVTAAALKIAPLARKGYRVLVPSEPTMTDVGLRFVGGFSYSRYAGGNPRVGTTVGPGVVVVVPGADDAVVARLRNMYSLAKVVRLTPPFDPAIVDHWLVILPFASPPVAGSRR
jgi:4-amino-4-deoxy-L-arabinose transferase-like glycosyltransferase